MTLKDGIAVMFDNLIMAADDLITLPTARKLAEELGLDFDPEAYDH